MSIQSVKTFEKKFCNEETLSNHDWKDVFFNTNSTFLLYFFRECSEHSLAHLDSTRSSVVHGLIKLQLSTADKKKNLKVLLTRDVDCNKPDGSGKVVLDYLIESNDFECIEVLLRYGHNIEVSDKCLTQAFQLRNKQEEVFKLLFAYAVRHKKAPYLTSVSDGDTFLHDVILHEKEKLPFKKWVGYFLSFQEVNIKAVNSNDLTIFDLLLEKNEVKRCKYTIKLLIKHRFPNISNNGDLELTLFSLNQKTTSQQYKNEIFKYLSSKVYLSLCKLKKESKNADTTDRKLRADGNGNAFSHKYLKPRQFPKQLATCSFKKLAHFSSPNNNNISIKLPNYEEVDITFETDEACQKSRHKICPEGKTKLSQRSIAKIAEVKNYISSNEAVAYCKSVTGEKAKIHYPVHKQLLNLMIMSIIKNVMIIHTKKKKKK